MGRLEDIVARNRQPYGGVRASVGMIWRGLALLILLGLLIFTDWAIPDAPSPPSAQPPAPAEIRLDGVPILRPAPSPR